MSNNILRFKKDGKYVPVDVNAENVLLKNQNGEYTGENLEDLLGEYHNLEQNYTPRLNMLEANDQNLTAQVAHIAIDVKYFGAKGDGVTDDSHAFELALQNMSNGDTLVIPYTDSGYLISRGLDLSGKTNITIKGLGGITKIKHIDNSNTLTFKAQNSENITFENLSIDVNGKNQDFNLYPAYVNTSFYLVDVDGITMNNIFVYDSVRDLKMKRCNNINCNNVHIDGARVDGWSLDDCDGGTLINISVKNVNQDDDLNGVLPGHANGIEIEDGTKNLSLYDVYTENCTLGAGITLQSHTDIEVCSNINIHDYECVNSDRALRIGGNSHDVFVSNFKARGLTSGLISLGGPECYNLTFKDFDLSGNGSITIRADSYNVVFKDGVIDAGDSYVFSLSKNYTYENYTFENIKSVSSLHFLSFSHASSSGKMVNSYINNCDTYSKNNSALYIPECEKITIENSIFKTDVSNNAFLISRCEDVYISNVTVISPNALYGFKLDGGGSNITFNNCRSISRGYGFLISSSTATNTTENVFFNNCNIELVGESGVAIRIIANPELSLNNIIVSNCVFKNCSPINWTNTGSMRKISLIGNIGIDTRPTNNWSGNEDDLVMVANNPPIEVPNLK